VLVASGVLAGVVLAAVPAAMVFLRRERAAAARHHALDQEIAVLRTRLQGAEEGAARRGRELQERLDALEADKTTLSGQLREREATIAELKSTQRERDESFRREQGRFEEQKKVLGKEFENLANRIFEQKGRSFSEASRSSLDTMLKPFREQIESFQKRVNEVHDESLRGNTHIRAEIDKVLRIGMEMSADAKNLTSALKGDSQQRGAWGEAQLRRTLEMSGLIEDAHYESQSSFKDEKGQSRQTDYIIKLPDQRHMIIDSKVSLLAYDKAVSAETPEQYRAAMTEHVRAVKKHIDELAAKDYTNLVGVRSPGFVLMFMPIEAAYIEALKDSRDLFSYGYENNVVLVSHTTLIPILRTVANLWMLERGNTEAREISEKAADIYNQVCVVAERLKKLGNTLGTVSNHYNATVTAMVGHQGLHGKVERFNQLSAKVSKSMPALEPAHIDFENERLLLAAEPLDESQALEGDDAAPEAEETTDAEESAEAEETADADKTPASS